MKEQDFGLATPTLGEKALFDSVATEHVHWAGTPLYFYKYDRKRSDVDPLYGEVTSKAWVGPYEFRAHFTDAPAQPTTRAEGFRLGFRSQAWISRQDFEQMKVPFPDVGDVLRIWNVEFINKFAVAGEVVPEEGFFFNIVTVNLDGHMADNADFSGFRLDISRLTEYSPERRIYAPEPTGA